MAGVKWLDRDLHQGPHLTLCVTAEQLTAAQDHLRIAAKDRCAFPPVNGGRMSAYTSPAGALACVVSVNPAPGSDGIAVAGLLVHEAAHVWQTHCVDIGERTPSDEMEAYAIQAIAERLMRRYAELTKGTNHANQT